ncbi:MAG TPA: homoserine dehydrogenase [Anaerolineaceae bacterium]|nr:homoserine dehydrogenase [Anaerolineaceae bacterium]
MQHYDLALIGFGNVGRALARLLLRKQPDLRDRYGLTFAVTGIYTGRHGLAIDARGLDLPGALELAETGQRLDSLSTQDSTPIDGLDFIRHVPAQVLFENSPVNHLTGQPAVDHLRAALQAGMHAITANKGPVVYAYSELNDLAAQCGRGFLFESAVMDGAPIFSLFREPLPAANLRGFFGILNSCTNLLLGLMNQGQTFDQAVEYARSIGITETDPSADIDGWDAAIKVAALITVLMGIPFTPRQVDRTGIRGITPQMLTDARQAGKRWKLVCTARRKGGEIHGRVAPEMVSPDSPLYSIGGTSSYVQFELDVLPGLGIVENDPGPDTTAYGLLADFINAIRG